MDCNLKDLFNRYKGQPIEVITESGMKYCGILVDVYDDNSIDIIDGKSRTVHIEARKIEAIIEPRMKLHRLCEEDDCCCKEENEEDNEEYEEYEEIENGDKNHC